MSDPKKIVDEWNAKHPVGTLVRIMGTKAKGRTSGRAFVSGHGPVVMVVGLEGENSGAWSLWSLEAVYKNRPSHGLRSGAPAKRLALDEISDEPDGGQR